ncbi:MAG TPA: hypothetical protein VK277_02775 [Acidimicrobiales bacterium]|nr:hypothetical protein [Acidimicrobiales bacterium]
MPSATPISDDRLLDLLGEALAPTVSEPTPEGLAALHAALAGGGDDRGADIVVLRAATRRRRLGWSSVAAAAAVFVFVITLAVVGGNSRNTKLSDVQLASEKLSQALRSNSSSATTAHDVEVLVDRINRVPPDQRAQLGTQPKQLLDQACDHLSGSQGAGPPAVCHALPALPGPPPHRAVGGGPAGTRTQGTTPPTRATTGQPPAGTGAGGTGAPPNRGASGGTGSGVTGTSVPAPTRGSGSPPTGTSGGTAPGGGGPGGRPPTGSSGGTPPGGERPGGRQQAPGGQPGGQPGGGPQGGGAR